MKSKFERWLLSLSVCSAMAFILFPQMILEVNGTIYENTEQTIEYRYYDTATDEWNIGTLSANSYNLVGTDTTCLLYTSPSPRDS